MNPMQCRNQSRWLVVALGIALFGFGTTATRAAEAAAEAATTPSTTPTPPPEEKKPKWETTAAAGLTLTEGNSDTLMFTLQFLTLRKWTRDEVRLGADVAYGKTEGDKTTESARAFGQYNRLFTDRFYGYGRAEIYHDAIADLDYRVTLSPGVGYYFVKSSTITLSGEVGPGFIMERIGNDDKQYFTLRLAERFEWAISKSTKLWESVEYLPQVDRFEHYLLNSEIGIDTQISAHWLMRTYLQDWYNSEPAPGREKNDLKLVAGIGYKF
jgi:putative salt-induced outer membrane protein YdiY